MTQQAQTDLQPDSKGKKAEEPAVELDSSYEQPVWQAAPIAQHAPREISPRQMLQLQRTVGNTAARTLQRNASNHAALQAAGSPPQISSAPDGAIQRRSATVKGKSLGKTSIRNAANAIVAKVAKNVVVDVDENTARLIGGKTYYKLNVNDADVDTLFTDVTSGFGDDVYIEIDAVTLGPATPAPSDDSAADDGDGVAAPDAEEADPASLEIELFEGHKFTLTPKGGKLEGEHEQKLDAPLPELDISIDIPIPAAPGVYVTAGLGVKPSLGMGAKLTYALEKDASETKFTVAGEITGTTGLEITAKALVGVGLANVAGVSAGLFAEAKASAELKGTLTGEVVKKTDKSWKSSSLKLAVGAEASIVGAVGAMLEAKLGPLTASKKYKLAQKEFAKFDWKRPDLTIEKAGIRMSDLIPKLADFKMAVNKNSASPLAEVEDPRAPLLGRGPRSDR